MHASTITSDKTNSSTAAQLSAKLLQNHLHLTLDFDPWLLTSDPWPLPLELWLLTLSLWPLTLTFDLDILTFDPLTFTLTFDPWPLILDLWSLTHDLWPLTSDLDFDPWPLSLTSDFWYFTLDQALGTHLCTSIPDMFLTPLAFQACFPWGRTIIGFNSTRCPLTFQVAFLCPPGTDWMFGTWGTFLSPYQGAGAISASGNGRDVIQYGGRKRKLRLCFDRIKKRSLYYCRR